MGGGGGEGRGSLTGSSVMLSRPLATYVGVRRSVGLSYAGSRLTFLLE